MGRRTVEIAHPERLWSYKSYACIIFHLDIFSPPPQLWVFSNNQMSFRASIEKYLSSLGLKRVVHRL